MVNALKRDGLEKKIIEFKQNIVVTSLLVSRGKAHHSKMRKELSCKSYGVGIRMSRCFVRNMALSVERILPVLGEQERIQVLFTRWQIASEICKARRRNSEE